MHNGENLRTSLVRKPSNFFQYFPFLIILICEDKLCDCFDCSFVCVLIFTVLTTVFKNWGGGLLKFAKSL